MTITENALKKLLTLAPNKGKMNYLLVYRQGGGCAGIIFRMKFLFAEDIANPVEHTITPIGYDLSTVTITGDNTFMDTVTLDFVDNGLQGSSFKFDSVESKGCCGCGKSIKC